ncbi:MAG: NAD(P)/FAD-dependent oxidoreductase [Thermoanaerobaculaceae bacterium]|nr:NAD(P)/FAD-dependent oxidoreductase [Thermoanaerobaculaceae bacterium]
MDYDIVIIGAGVVGLAIASELANLKKEILVLEKNESFGMETSSRSSEVIHAGVYYPKDSLKAKLCVKGNELLYNIAQNNDIPYKNCGKLIVATSSEEEKNLSPIMEHSLEIGAKGVRVVENTEIKKLEPNVYALSAVYFPTSGIVDSHSLMKFFYGKAKENGVDFLFKGEVFGIEKKESFYRIEIKEYDGQISSVSTKIVINSAGLNSGKIAEIAGFDVEKLKYKIYYRKGIYFRVQKKLANMPKMLIYPVPPEDSTVGIHTVPELSGGMRLGPYDFWVNEIDYSVDSSYLDLFYIASKKFLPILEKEDLSPDMAGFQAKRYGPNEKSRDFIIKEESKNGFPNFINLIGIESPGLTSSPSIAVEVKEIVKNL